MSVSVMRGSMGKGLKDESRKTRIETDLAVSSSSLRRRVSKMNPEKQGLKHDSASAEYLQFTLVSKMNPEKQGLKQWIDKFGKRKAQSLKDESRKTRIETHFPPSRTTILLSSQR